MLVKQHGILVDTPSFSAIAGLMEGKWIVVDARNPEKVVATVRPSPKGTDCATCSGAKQVDQDGKKITCPTCYGVGKTLPIDSPEDAAEFIKKVLKGDEDQFSARFVAETKPKKAAPVVAPEVEPEAEQPEADPDAPEEIADDGEIPKELKGDLSGDTLRKIQLYRATHEAARTVGQKTGKIQVGRVQDNNPEGYMDNDPTFPSGQHLANVWLPLALDVVGRRPWTVEQVLKALAPRRGQHFRGGMSGSLVKRWANKRAGFQQQDAESEADEATLKALATDKGISPFATHVWKRMNHEIQRKAATSGIIRNPNPRGAGEGQWTDTHVSTDETLKGGKDSVASTVPDTTPTLYKAECPTCGGDKTIQNTETDPPTTVTCPTCKGQGKIVITQKRERINPLSIAVDSERKERAAQIVNEIIIQAQLTPKQELIYRMQYGMPKPGFHEDLIPTEGISSPSEIANRLGLSAQNIRTAIAAAATRVQRVVNTDKVLKIDLIDFLAMTEGRRRYRTVKTGENQWTVEEYTRLVSAAGERLHNQYDWRPIPGLKPFTFQSLALAWVREQEAKDRLTSNPDIKPA